VAHILVAKLGKFLAFAMSMKVCISLVGNLIKWKVPRRPPNLRTSCRTTEDYDHERISFRLKLTQLNNIWRVRQITQRNKKFIVMAITLDAFFNISYLLAQLAVYQIMEENLFLCISLSLSLPVIAIMRLIAIGHLQLSQSCVKSQRDNYLMYHCVWLS